MRQEKRSISAEYLARISNSPFVYLLTYRGLNTIQFSELRKRLSVNGAEVHVVKNSIFQIAAKEAGLGDLAQDLKGQIAVVTGGRDMSASAKVLRAFSTEFDKAKVTVGFLGEKKLTAQEVSALADLPSIEVLRSKLLGVLQAPASALVRTVQAPSSQIARVIEAKFNPSK